MISQINEIISIINSTQLQRELVLVRSVFIFFTIMFFIGVLYFLISSSYIKHHFWYDVIEFFAWQPYGFLNLTKRWNHIKQKLEGKGESDYKVVLLEADDFLNKVLEKKGYKGETLEDKLEKIELVDLPNKEEIEKAHQIRNSVVYDPDFDLDLAKAREAVDNYEKAIKGLGML